MKTAAPGFKNSYTGNINLALKTILIRQYLLVTHWNYS